MTRLLSVLLLLVSGSAFSAQWTQTNLVNWTPGVTVGVQGGIPTNRTNLIDVTQSPYFADNTGVIDASTAIQNAVDAATSNQVVYLPAGTYKFAATLAVQVNKNLVNTIPITIRGAGTNTIIVPTSAVNGAYFINGGSDQTTTTTTIAAGGLVAGSSNVTVSSTAGFPVGALAHVYASDNTNQYASPVTLHVSSYRNNRGQEVMITATNATQITFWPPLYSSYNGTNGGIYTENYQMNGVGLENFAINMTNTGSSTVGIQFHRSVNCWMTNVVVYNAYSYNIYVWEAVFAQLQHCSVGPTARVGNNGSGYKFDTVSASLLENCISIQNFPSLEMNFGSSGNVVAYNFFWDTYQTQSGASIDSNHGPHNEFNLYEGNECPYFQADGFFGSTSDDTAYRNWLHEIQPETSATNGFYLALSLNRFTRNYNIVGNFIGTNGVHGIDIRFGDPNIGNWGNDGTNAPPWPDWPAMLSAAPGAGPGQYVWQEVDTNVFPNTLMQANYFYFTNGVNTPLTGGTNLQNSLYLAAKPSFFGNLTYPPFDISNTNVNLKAIPAGYRYFTGNDPPVGPINTQSLGTGTFGTSTQ